MPAQVVNTADDAPEDVDPCPWCGQAIPHEKFDEIHKRIRAKERERAAEFEAKAKAQVEKARKEAAVAIESAKEAAKAQADAAREEGKKAAEAQMAPKLVKVQKAKATAEKQ